MNESVTYEGDFFAWSQRQASVLRDLAASRRDLPNELDIDHVAEEIEEVGRAELNAVQSLFASSSFTSSGRICAGRGTYGVLVQRGRGFHNELRIRFSHMRQRIDLDALWAMAIREAEADLAIYNQRLSPELPSTCPLNLDDITSENFAVATTVSAGEPPKTGFWGLVSGPGYLLRLATAAEF